MTVLVSAPLTVHAVLFYSFNCLLVISLESTISAYAATTSTTSDAAITTTTVTTIGAYYIMY